MKPLGADRVEIGPAGSVVLVAAVSKSWTPRSPRTLTSAEHPGTAVEWDGRLFEVLDAAPSADGSIRYRLAPWEDRHAIRRIERYDALTEEIRASERRDRSRDVVRRRLAILSAPLAGLLPGGVQRKMERDFGAPATWMTISSALPLFVVGFLGIFRVLVGVAGGVLSLPAWLAPAPPVAAYLFLESTLRLASAVAAGEPMGTLPAALVLALVQAIRKPAGERPAAVPPTISPDGGDVHDRELVHVLEPVLALLAAGDQERLVLRFGFQAIRWGWRTAACLLALSVLNVAFSLAAFDEPGDLVGGILWNLPALYLAAEQIRRFRELSEGRPAGSVLGRLVRPFAKPLLR